MIVLDTSSSTVSFISIPAISANWSSEDFKPTKTFKVSKNPIFDAASHNNYLLLFAKDTYGRDYIVSLDLMTLITHAFSCFSGDEIEITAIAK